MSFSTKLQKKSFFLLLITIWTILFLMALPSEANAIASTFTVTNNNPSGAGSLSQAIADANDNNNPDDQDVIDFNINSSAPVTIKPNALLEITESLLINGYTQGDATPNTSPYPYPFNGKLRVVIDASNSGSINVVSDDVSIKGIVINLAKSSNINLSQIDNFSLEGSYLNTDDTGMARSYSLDDTFNTISITGSTNVKIGGSSPDKRNIIGNCSANCIDISSSGAEDSSNVIIQGNYFGVASDGMTNMGYSVNFMNTKSTGVNIHARSRNVIIGGEAPGEGNNFERQRKDAIRATDASDIFIYGNRFVFNSVTDDRAHSAVMLLGVTNVQVGSGSEQAKNTFAGNLGSIVVNDSEGSGEPSVGINIRGNNFGFMDFESTAFDNFERSILIKGNSEDILIAYNTLWNSTWSSGVLVQDNAQSVSILSNSIYDNSQKGIGLDTACCTVINDESDSDTGPNGLLNYPENITLEEKDGDSIFRYDLDLAAGDYRIEFFANTAMDGSGHGEGEIYLGYAEITHSGSGRESFTSTIEGDGYSNVTTTATERNTGSLSTFGSTSEFSRSATQYIPEEIDPIVDLSLTGKLDNPEDVAIGASLNFTFTITNHGPDSIDISGFDNSNLGVNSLLQFVLPTDLSYSNTVSSDSNCLSLGQGSAAYIGPILGNHTDHEFGFCGYTGPSKILEAGQTHDIVVQFIVNEESDLNFAVLGIGPISTYDTGYDNVMATVNQGDIIDLLTSTNTYPPPNEVAWITFPIYDTGVQADFLNTEDIAPGKELEYKITITNHGTHPIDLTDFDNSGLNPLTDSLLVGAIDPDLTYTGISGEDVSCIWPGPGSASLVNPLFKNHAEHSLLMCAYTGSDILLPGESLTFTISALVEDNSDINFSNFVYLFPRPGDPDEFDFRRAISESFASTSLNDFIDDWLVKLPGSNNYSISTYSSNGMDNSTNDPDATDSPDHQNNDLSKVFRSALEKTGISHVILLIILASGLSILSIVVPSKRDKADQPQIKGDDRNDKRT